ncbi:MAG: M24 family metallopeptidase [Saccharospirillum sp.]
MIAPTMPTRGFAVEEYQRRTRSVQSQMQAQGIRALLLTTEPEFRYFSGFLSQFWESPTRPWFLVMPDQGNPIAVVPEIGVTGLEQTWIEDIRSWPAPRPEDDGVSLLAEVLSDCCPHNGQLGAMLGPETQLRMPAHDFAQLQQRLAPRHWEDAAPTLRAVRSIKSPAEIDKTRFVCEVTAAGFAVLREQLRPGMTERETCKILHQAMLGFGADSCPYLVSASGPGGYDNIIMGPTDRRLDAGDVLIIDTGARFDGYFSDFDRNFALTQADRAVQKAYDATYRATEAGLRLATPGCTTGELWQAMWQVLENDGALGNAVGRMGHGLGMQLTEWPSIVPGGDVVLQAGMVMTLEPGMTFAPGKMMVHEENIVITEQGCQLLHSRAPVNLPIIA